METNGVSDEAEGLESEWRTPPTDYSKGPNFNLLNAVMRQSASGMHDAIVAGANPRICPDGTPLVCTLAFRGFAEGVEVLFGAGIHPESCITVNGGPPPRFIQTLSVAKCAILGGSSDSHMAVLNLCIDHPYYTPDKRWQRRYWLDRALISVNERAALLLVQRAVRPTREFESHPIYTSIYRSYLQAVAKRYERKL